MITARDYYSKKTVAFLRDMLAIDGIKVNSRTKKDVLVTYVVNMLDDYHSVARDMEGEMLDAQYQSEAEAERIASGRQFVKDGVTYGALWNCCAAKPAKVIVFDNGSKHAVCSACASVYTGPVEEIPEPDPMRDPELLERERAYNLLNSMQEFHLIAVRRYNPTMKRDKNGMVILTRKQAKRIHKKDRKFAKKIGIYDAA